MIGRRKATFFSVLSGIAAPFGEVSDPSHSGERFRFQPGAFERTLREINRGDRMISLLKDHDPNFERATSRDGDFRLRDSKEGLLLEICRGTALGEYLTSRFGGLLHTWNCLSLGFTPVTYTRLATCASIRFLDVTEASIDEVSIVKTGAFPSAKFKF